MLVDANILLYAVDETSSFHDAARAWMEDALNGPRRVGIPWMSITAFMRIATHARALNRPLSPREATRMVADWLEAPTVWIPAPGAGHHQILERLVVDLELRGNLISDAVLAALCIEHGVPIVSADSDFGRFTEIAWLNPVGR